MDASLSKNCGSLILLTSLLGDIVNIILKFYVALRWSMEANRRQGGIKLLLAAEQEAQQIVNAARSGKSTLNHACFAIDICRSLSHL